MREVDKDIAKTFIHTAGFFIRSSMFIYSTKNFIYQNLNQKMEVNQLHQ